MYSIMSLFRLFFSLLALTCGLSIPSPAMASDRSAAGQGQDWSRAERAFRVCAGCHTLSPSGEHRGGPNLYGLMSREIASAPGFAYSSALRAAGGRWTSERLSAFLEDPRDFAPRSKMAYHGIKSAPVRDDLVAWLIWATQDSGQQAAGNDIAATLASGDADNGRNLFRPCMACHSFEEGGRSKIGPNLFGIVGRPSASFPGFRYSDALEKRNTVWSPMELNRFFIEKKQFGQGTHRAFQDLPTLEARADLIAWLRTLQPQNGGIDTRLRTAQD